MRHPNARNALQLLYKLTRERYKPEAPMNLSQLYYFRKLAEVKHYTHAAEELFISQPTLSNSISQLEKELGIPLFKREGRTIKLTRYGAEF